MSKHDNAISRADEQARHFARKAEAARDMGNLADAGRYADKAAAFAKVARELAKAEAAEVAA